MAKPYGKYPRKAKAPAAAKPRDSLLVNIPGLYTMEQISHELQKAIAQLHDRGAYGVEDVKIYLHPLNAKAERIALHDDDNKPIDTIELNVPVKQAAFRPD